MKNTDKHNTGPPYNTYRLRFTDAERADPVLAKTIRKADKGADKLEVVQAKIHKKKILIARRTVDAETGKSTVRLRFEEIDRKKPPSKLTHAVRDVPVSAALSQFHREIRQSEDDNVGVEAAHKSEETAELSVRAGRSAYRSHTESLGGKGIMLRAHRKLHVCFPFDRKVLLNEFNIGEYLIKVLNNFLTILGKDGTVPNWSKIRMPSSLSSILICLLMFGSVTYKVSAAFLMEPFLTTSDT